MLLEKIVYKWLDIDIYTIKLILENYGFFGLHVLYAPRLPELYYLVKIVRIIFEFLR